MLCFSSYKNLELKVKLGWVGARERRKNEFFVTFVLSGRFFYLCFISMYSVLNKISEHIYVSISTNITSYTLLIVFKIVESTHCILNKLFLPSAATTSLIKWPCKYSLLQTADLQTFKWWLATPHLTLLESF